jgi:site-specific recombinase XerD
MDSRAGAITEATEAGADLEHIKQAATHSDISMTQRYSRGAEEKTAGVMRQRAEYRANKIA